MADSFITLNTNSTTGASVDTRTNTAGEHRQVVILGDGAATSDNVAAVSSANGLAVDVTRVGGTVNAALVVNSASSTVQIGTVVINSAATGGLTANVSDNATRDNGKIDIAGFDVALPAGTNNIGLVTLAPATTGGWTPSFVPALNANSVVTVKIGAATLGTYYIYNPNGTAAYVQIFDIAGAVTLGVSIPVWSIGIVSGGAANLEFTAGLNFANAIKVAATTASSNSTAVTTPLDCNFGYK